MNIGRVASVRQRLRNLARERGVDYNRLQLLYMQERWLARLGHSPHRDNLILKGGLYLYSNFGLTSRPTRDIDFLGRVAPAEVTELVQMISEITKLELPDGVSFDPNSITGEENRSATEYGGVRVELYGYLGTARERIQIDVGFGDALPKGPVELTFPSLLNENISSLLAYSFETVIAEKLQAAAVLLEVNSRYKDFFDIHQLASVEVFSAVTLREAITATFARRHTPTGDIHHLFLPAFTEDSGRQAQWQAFLRRVGQAGPENFADLMKRLERFLEPILSSRTASQWQPTRWSWIDENEFTVP